MEWKSVFVNVLIHTGMLCIQCFERSNKSRRWTFFFLSLLYNEQVKQMCTEATDICHFKIFITSIFFCVVLFIWRAFFLFSILSFYFAILFARLFFWLLCCICDERTWVHIYSMCYLLHVVFFFFTLLSFFQNAFTHSILQSVFKWLCSFQCSIFVTRINVKIDLCICHGVHWAYPHFKK